jgi:prepilin-type N-terminal cleavage/methylation domain-containing protein
VTRARTPGRSREAGFSLIELLIVLVFISVGILALAMVQTVSVKDVGASGRYSRGLSLARQHMEITCSGAFTGAVGDSGTSGVYSWWSRVDSTATLKTVTTTVTWTDRGQTRSVRLMNLLSQR